RRSIDHLHLPSFPLRPSRVHAKEICGEQRSLVAALRALDLNDDVAIVVRILGQEQHLQLLLELSHLLGRASLLGPHVLLHVRVLLVPQHLARRLHLLLRAAKCVVGLDDLAQRTLLAGEAGQLLVVGRDLGPGHLIFDLVVAARDRLQSIYHAAAPAVSSSPSRALLNAVMATSSMSSEGSRVVNFWVPSTGRSAMRTTGL